MKIFTKRNAVVGYVTLKAHSRARRRWMRSQRRRSGWKIAALVVLGVVSVGVLVAFAGAIHRRQRDGLGTESADTAGEVEAAAEDLAASVEPIPAT